MFPPKIIMSISWDIMSFARHILARNNDIPYIRFFSRHVFSANQNQKQCTKFTRIKFSLFQSRRENINHDCSYIWICNWRNYVYYIKIFYMIYEILLYLIIYSKTRLILPLLLVLYISGPSQLICSEWLRSSER
jgi:hypothetical protein